MQKFTLIISSILLATTVMAQENVTEAGAWRVSVNETTGKASIAYNNTTILAENEAEWGLVDNKTTFSTLTEIAVTSSDYQDEFGTGKKLVVQVKLRKLP